MKKVFILLVSLFAMTAAGTGLKAQEVSIMLHPEWNWIGYPFPESVDLGTAFGGFEPLPGDVIESYYDYSEYVEGYGWFGGVDELHPGWGYMYYSSRTEAVNVVLFAPTSQVSVATATPTGITAESAIVSGTVTVPEGTHVFLRGVCWGTMPNPDIDGDHTTEETGIGSFSSTLEGLNPNTTYYVRAYVVSDHGLAYGSEQSFTTEAGGSGGGNHAYVDLGLPSGLLWATCNVGANAPEEYGDYFAWGETLSKDVYDESSYQYNMDNALTKYCNNVDFGYNGFTDNLTTLLPEDDAATVNWGVNWRMPTKAEWQELYNNTTCEWTIQNNVYGLLFTASNGASLFLPAAGSRWNSGLTDAGYNGVYWSSSLFMDDPNYAWDFYFFSDDYDMDYGSRNFGFSVRPVRITSNAPTGAIDGKFTINADGDQVYFSQGNLQYIGSAATPYWKFADNQWDVLGTTTGQNSSDQNVDRDLFGWGTSGWNNGNVYYQPYDTQDNGNNIQGYGYGPTDGTSYTYNLTGSYANADWGVYNSISNGGNQANQWRTLTHSEWAYVFNTRTTSSGIRYAKANVNDVNGVILLPDDWSSDTYSLSNTNSSEASYSSNTISATQWSALEQAGAVFLLAAGYRYGTSVYNVGSGGYYWSASYSDSYGARSVYFNDEDFDTDLDYRYIGHCVRLVAPVEN